MSSFYILAFVTNLNTTTHPYAFSDADTVFHVDYLKTVELFPVNMK